MPFLDDLGITDSTKTVELSAWQRPARVELRDGRLVGTGVDSDWKSARSNNAGLLVNFARLEHGHDDQIRRFAETWGMLDLCGHNRPRTHTSRSTSELGAPPPPTCDLPVAGGEGEPVDSWRAYAAQASAFLTIHRCLLDGSKTKVEVWNPLRPLFPRFLNLPSDRPREGMHEVTDLSGLSGYIGEIRLSIPTLREARPAIAYAVRRWMDMGAVTVRFEWSGSIGSLTFGGQSLFGALATIVAVTLSGVDGPILCSHCRLPYNPERKPRGPRHYCEQCRADKQPQKYAKQAYNARQREKQADRG